MSSRQISVPYREGYNIGIGVDLTTGAPMGLAVVGAPSTVTGSGGANVQFSVRRITSTEELEEALGIDAEASYGCAAFGGGVDARFSFAKNSKVQSSSLFMTVTAQVQLGFMQIDDPALSPDADDMLQRPDLFAQRYGNGFVRGIRRGGLFVGLIRIETASSEQSQQISGELQGSYGLFSAEVKTNFSSVAKKYNCSLYVDMYHEGGPVNLTITDPQDPAQLLGNANLFLQSFADNPDHAAVPYFVTLAPAAIARSKNMPLNEADIDHAQDVLVACTKARSRILDKLNLLEYLLASPDKFTYPETLTPSALAACQQSFEFDMDTVAQCASAAINKPAEARMPAEFAEAHGRGTYPKGVLPDQMPVSRQGKLVDVPDVTSCRSWSEVNARMTEVGLVAEQVIASMPPDTFGVLAVSPPAGTPVPEGGKVSITTRPAKPSPFLSDYLKATVSSNIRYADVIRMTR